MAAGAMKINRLAVDLGRLGFRATAEVSRVVRATGQRTVTGAQAIVPVRTGNLKSSIGVDYDSDGLGFTAGSSVRYAGFVEFGTSRMAPRAYMGPSFDRAVAGAIPALESVVGRPL